MRTEEALALIMVIAVVLRLLPFGFWGFVGSDPYVHLGVAKHFERSGFIDYPFSNFPFGYRVTEPLGMYLVPLLIYHLIPSTLTLVFQLTPVIFACISIAVGYLLFRELFDKRTSLIACALLAISTANITRTGVGIYRGEMLFMPFMLLSLLFLARSRKNWKEAGFSGLFAGISSYLWNGYPFVTVAVSGFYLGALALLYLRKISVEEVIRGFALFSAVYLAAVNVGYLTGIVPVRTAFTDVYFPLFALSVGCVFCVGERFVAGRRLEYLLVAGAAGTALTLFFFPTAINYLSTGFGLVIPQNEYNLSIEELQRPTFEFLYLTLDATVFLSIFGLLALVLDFAQKPNWRFGMVLVWFAASAYVAFASTRFIFLASYVFAALSAHFISGTTKRNKTRGYALVVVVFAMMFYHTYLIRMQMRSDVRWEPALNYIKERTPLDAGFVVWRDYGGMVQAFGERATVADSVFGQNQTTLRAVVSFLFDGAYDFPGDYVVVDKQQLTELPGMVSMMGLGYEATIQLLNFVQQGNFVHTSPLEFIVDLANRSATLQGVGVDLLMLETFGTTLYPADEPKVPGCLYLQSSGVAYLSQDICDSNFLKLAFLDGVDGLNLTYRDEYISIYEI
jgi:dolichyl-diphosphooligosaccharide--protein glycosyltransferase